MKKTRKFLKLFIFVLLCLLIINTASSNTIDAKRSKESSYIYINEEITLTNKTSHFYVGFVRVDFKKDCLPEDQYPVTFEVKLYAEDGEVYIEFDPDVDDFFKDVQIHVYHFEGYIYDVAIDEYIYVEIPNEVFRVPHFSRWCFAW